MNSSLFIISGQSAVGKTNIVERLIAQGIGTRVITCTTRTKRPSEEDGRDYHFLSREKFEEKLKKGEFAEYAKVYGNFYGTLTSDIERTRAHGGVVLIIMDVQGARSLIARYGDARSIFITLHSKEILAERFRKRGDSEETIMLRMRQFDKERSEQEVLDKVVFNDRHIDEAVHECAEYIKSFRTSDKIAEGVK